MDQSFPHLRSLTLFEMIKPFKAVRRKDLEKAVRVSWESDVDEASLILFIRYLEGPCHKFPLATEKYRLALHPRGKD